MAWAIRIEDYTSGSLTTSTISEFSTIELAQERLHNTVNEKSSQLSYTLELARDDKYDGHSSDSEVREASILHFHYVRDDNGDWVYTGIVYHTDYPHYSRTQDGVMGDNDEPKEGG